MDIWQEPDKEVVKKLAKGTMIAAFRESFLRYQRSKNPYFGLKDSQTMDIDQLWSSTIAGAFTGGILSGLSRGVKAVPSGTFMFGVIAMGGQFILTKTNRYRQDRILATVPLEVTSSSTSTPPAPSEKRDAIVNSILNILPVHKTDMGDYEAKLRQRLQLIEAEQQFLEIEAQRRKQLSLASSEAAYSVVDVADGQDKT
ncbi:hypothetical protein BG011_001123, partial [Mortierella polycephala]